MGQNGSGKTTLARYLLEARSLPIMVFDWKGLIRWDGYKRFTKLKAFHNYCIRHKKDFRAVYAPDITELNQEKFWEAFFKFAYHRRNCQIYVDEVSAITDGDDIPYWYLNCLARGRERGISTFSSTQRPMRIPQVVLSEAEHFYIFRLQMQQDRAKVENMTGLDADRIIGLPKQRFYYANAEGDISGPYKLDIRR